MLQALRERGRTGGGRTLVAVAAGIGLAYFVSELTTVPGKRSRKFARHLVIICVDTLRRDHLGSYGYDRPTSPRLDLLAAQGAVFDRVQAQSNWTVPATASIMTSRYPAEHGAGLSGSVRGLSDEAPPTDIHSSVRTVAEILKEAGLHTALYSANPYLRGRFMAGFDDAKVEWVQAAELTNRAIDWSTRHRDDRFFIYLQLMDLHQPLRPPEPFFTFFQTQRPEATPEAVLGWSFRRQEDLNDAAFRRYRAQRIGLYDGAVRYVDTEVGRLVDHLEGLGIMEETLVVITTDHGEEFWDHAEEGMRLGGDPRGIWGVGHGHSMYQELLSIPLILHGPGIEPGRRSQCDASQLDIAPTALDGLGLAPESSMQGASLFPLMARGASAPCRSLPLISESPAYGPDAIALVWEGLKLIVRADGVALLFDLGRDPREARNLATERPDVVERLTHILVTQMRQRRNASGQAIPMDPDTVEALKALGYVSSPK